MNKKGFTLIEIAITVVIIGLLAGFVIVQTQDKEQLFNEVKVKSDLEILKTGIVSYSYYN
jgi:prepilin-type N-terminal cleavage/methylation domain-containing protein